MSYNMKNLFHEEGVFTVRLTPLGAKFCLMKDLVEGDILIFINERKEWWSHWFKVVRP